MTDTNVPAPAGAQTSADANSIDSIIDDHFKSEDIQNTTQKPEGDAGASDPVTEDPWPKKAQNALSRRDKQIGKLKAELDAARQESAKYREQPSQQTQNDTQGGQLSPAKTGIPTKLKETDFSNYAEFIEARAEEIADWKIDKKFAERDVKQKETEASTKESAWREERAATVDKQAENFLKDHADAQALYDEHADTIHELPQNIKDALLAADNTHLAMYNLAKDGKLEDLADMSLVDAKVEIRLAQLKQPEKPQSKAPAPLSTSRGSVASKSLGNMSGKELLKIVSS